MALHKLNTLIFIKYLRTLLEKYSVYPASLGHLHLQNPLSGKKPWMLERSLLYSTEVSSLPFLLIGPGSPPQGHGTNLVGLLHANPLFNRSPKTLLSPHHWGDILKFQQRVPVSKRDTVCVSSWSGN